MDNFKETIVKKVLATINSIPYYLHAAGKTFTISQRVILQGLINYGMGEAFNNKFGLWLDTQSSKDNTRYSSGRILRQSKVLFQIEKAAKSNDSDIQCYVFRMEDAVA